MSAEVLRRAAALMRENAQAATTHTPWQLLEDDDYAPPWTVASTHPEGERTWVCKDALHAGAHIASWHPAVALAVADWLDGLADGWADDPGCDLGGGYDFSPPCESCFRCAYYETQMRALAVARAHLGT